MPPGKGDPSSCQAPLVAIVDDDDSLRASACMLVNSFGFRAEAFATAEDFLQSPQVDETACLILDMLMPNIDGLELQRRLKRTRPHLPIIFITAHAREHEERLAIAAGAVAVLRKPVPEDTLLTLLKASLQH